ncbi:MAG: 50S ribosomal protein L15, partial [Actinomycetota bacterium]
MKVHELTPAPGSRKRAKRVGRGIGGRGGKTAGRGTKGQRARGTVAPGFEGGQMPLYQRLPKRGFKNPFRVEHAELNIGRLQAAIDAGKVDAGQPVTSEVLSGAGLVRRGMPVRLLGQGELKA